MRVSISITDYSWPAGPAGTAAALSEVARVADETGIDTVWVADHLLQADPTVPADGPVLEAWTTLGLLAGLTRRVRLGTMVSAATFRPPAVLVKAATTLDVLSGGRAWFGVGAGHHEGEARALGLPFPPARERLEHLEDTLRIAQRMWSGAEAPFVGTHHRLERPFSPPAPLHRPHPPVLVGGMGERVTLRLVAQYADACNLFDIPDGGRTARHRLDVLARHCERVGRPFDDVERTVSTRVRPGESVDEVTRRFEALASLGFQHAVVITPGPWTTELIDVLAHVAERLGEPAAARS
jgi:F420-dependent oxidoreductase-like protein